MKFVELLLCMLGIAVFILAERFYKNKDISLSAYGKMLFVTGVIGLLRVMFGVFL